MTDFEKDTLRTLLHMFSSGLDDMRSFDGGDLSEEAKKRLRDCANELALSMQWIK